MGRPLPLLAVKGGEGAAMLQCDRHIDRISAAQRVVGRELSSRIDQLIRKRHELDM